MPRVVGIDHLVLCVGNFARSKVFYEKLLGFLGFKLKYDYAEMSGSSPQSKGRCRRRALANLSRALAPVMLESRAERGPAQWSGILLANSAHHA